MHAIARTVLVLALSVGCGARNETVGGGDGLTLTFEAVENGGFDGAITIAGTTEPKDPIRPESGAWVSIQVGDRFDLNGVPTGAATVVRTRADGATVDVSLTSVVLGAAAEGDLDGYAVLDDDGGTLTLGPFDDQSWDDDFRSGQATGLVYVRDDVGDAFETSELTVSWSFDTELASWRESAGVGGVTEGPG